MDRSHFNHRFGDLGRRYFNHRFGNLDHRHFNHRFDNLDRSHFNHRLCDLNRCYGFLDTTHADFGIRLSFGYGIRRNFIRAGLIVIFTTTTTTTATTVTLTALPRFANIGHWRSRHVLNFQRLHFFGRLIHHRQRLTTARLQFRLTRRAFITHAALRLFPRNRRFFTRLTLTALARFIALGPWRTSRLILTRGQFLAHRLLDSRGLRLTRRLFLTRFGRGVRLTAARVVAILWAAVFTFATTLGPWAAIVSAARATLTFTRHRCFFHFGSRRRFGSQHAFEPGGQTPQQTGLFHGLDRGRGLDRRTFSGQRRRLLRRNALYRGFLTLDLGFFLTKMGHGFFFLHFHPAIARRIAQFQQVVVTQAHDLVMRGFQIDIRNQHHVHVKTLFNRVNFSALFIQQEGGNIDRHLGMHRPGVFLHGFFLDDAQDMQRRGLGTTNETDTVATRAWLVAGFTQRRLQALTRQFQQTKARQLAHLHPSAVVLQDFAQAVFHIALILDVFHVDEIDHDQAAQVTQTELTRNFFRRFHIGFEGGFFDIGALGGARRVDVDRHQRFGMVDHNRPARRQLYAARERGFDLVFNLEAREQRHLVLVQLYAPQGVGHDVADELTRLFVNFVGIDQNFADFGVVIIANGANHQTTFLQDQERSALRARRAFNRAPQLQQISQIPLQFFVVATNTCGARNQAHAARDFQLSQQILEFLTFFTFDTARHATTTRIVRHQHQITTGQADISGQGRALIAAFVFFHLNDDFHALTQHVLNPRTTTFKALEIRSGNFLEWQKAMAIGAVIDKARFQGRLDTGNQTLIDVPFALLFSNRFNIQINELLPVDDGNAQLFSLRCVKQHTFHVYVPCAALTQGHSKYLTAQWLKWALSERSVCIKNSKIQASSLLPEVRHRDIHCLAAYAVLPCRAGRLANIHAGSNFAVLSPDWL